MTAPPESVACANCGAELDICGDALENRVPCVKCGSTRRVYNASVVLTTVARCGIGVTVKRSGEKKPYVEDKSMPSHSHLLGKLVHHERLIDRENDRYRERVTDYESGEVIYSHEEPLSQHYNHGSAKSKKRNPDG